MSMTIEAAREFLEHGVSSELKSAMKTVPAAKSLSLAPNQLDALGHAVVEVLTQSRAMRAVLLRVLLDLDRPAVEDLLAESHASDDWLRIEQVAKMVGFSAPYARAILDKEPFFKGKVNLSLGGQRKVLAQDVMEWMKLKGIKLPQHRHRLLQGGRETPEYFDEPPLGLEETAQLAKKVQSDRELSLRHRPPSKA